ncbi:bifunctional demethylmenaquinone methyltransferase/2-methoxy-6-polyprenyl-1,4-benzoquinol methylase UbiE, partial [Acidithiobacillus ferrooxidans]|nr:bifunctional demethylmenaquinone methyltransferase/2-methoxy-6-polyprenyl-1,4-benzoquinol methylase UbiE [Acidithiobacillus ferrooxidans]
MSAHHENGEQSQALVPTTHFGYQEVPETEKEQLVRGVFSNV